MSSTAACVGGHVCVEVGVRSQVGVEVGVCVEEAEVEQPEGGQQPEDEGEEHGHREGQHGGLEEQVEDAAAGGVGQRAEDGVLRIHTSLCDLKVT